MSILRRALPWAAVTLLVLAIAGSTIFFMMGLGWVAAGILMAAFISELIGFAIAAGNSPVARRAAALRDSRS